MADELLLSFLVVNGLISSKDALL